MQSVGLGVLRLSGTGTEPRWRGRLHVGALFLAIPAAGMLAWRARSPAMLGYALALPLLFAVSAAYHLLPVADRHRQLLRRVDHAMIYLYMAAAYAPFCLDVVRGTLGWVVLAGSWAGAAVGLAAKALAFQRTRALAGVVYGLVGWLAVVTVPDVLRRLDPLPLSLLFATGLFYTAGALVLCLRHPDPVPDVFGYHEVWHAAVILATACYFGVVWTVVTGA